MCAVMFWKNFFTAQRKSINAKIPGHWCCFLPSEISTLIDLRCAVKVFFFFFFESITVPVLVVHKRTPRKEFGTDTLTNPPTYPTSKTVYCLPQDSRPSIHPIPPSLPWYSQANLQYAYYISISSSRERERERERKGRHAHMHTRTQQYKHLHTHALDLISYNCQKLVSFGLSDYNRGTPKREKV